MEPYLKKKKIKYSFDVILFPLLFSYCVTRLYIVPKFPPIEAGQLLYYLTPLTVFSVIIRSRLWQRVFLFLLLNIGMYIILKPFYASRITEFSLQIALANGLYLGLVGLSTLLENKGKKYVYGIYSILTLVFGAFAFYKMSYQIFFLSLLSQLILLGAYIKKPKGWLTLQENSGYLYFVLVVPIFLFFEYYNYSY